MNRRLLRSGWVCAHARRPSANRLAQGAHGRPRRCRTQPRRQQGSDGLERRHARIWDAANGSVLVSLKGYEEAVRNAGFSPDGERILTATFDGVARIWDVSSYQPR